MEVSITPMLYLMTFYTLMLYLSRRNYGPGIIVVAFFMREKVCCCAVYYILRLFNYFALKIFYPKVGQSECSIYRNFDSCTFTWIHQVSCVEKSTLKSKGVIRVLCSVLWWIQGFKSLSVITRK